jgi:hypothetical protein
LIVRVSITADRDMPDALLTDLLPAGAWRSRTSTWATASSGPTWWWTASTSPTRGSEAEIRHEEFRDDRYIAALKLSAGEPGAPVLPGARGHAGHLHRRHRRWSRTCIDPTARRWQGGAGDGHGGATLMFVPSPALREAMFVFPSPALR